MHSFFVAPANFDVVVVSGPDAARFLQGQLTCDVDSVEEGRFCYGAACNNKGRVYAAFTLVRWQDQWYLCMAAGLGAVFVNALKKYLPFYKCSMQLSDPKLHALAGGCVSKALSMVGTASETVSAEKAVPVNGGWLCVLNSDASRALLLGDSRELLPDSAVEATLDQWEALAMIEGHYPFRLTDSEKFTPQELHYDRNGYVSFSKGCYTGQEIVARMYYRGKLKKQLYLITMDAPSPDSDVFTIHDAAGIEIANTLVSRVLDGKTFALVSLPVDAANHIKHLFDKNGRALDFIPFQSEEGAPQH